MSPLKGQEAMQADLQIFSLKRNLTQLTLAVSRVQQEQEVKHRLWK